MWLHTLLRTWLARRQSPIQSRKKIAVRKRAKPTLETLEDRLCPSSATVSYASGTLDFTASAGETITVTSPGTNQIEIVVSDTITLGSGTTGDFTLSPDNSTLTINNVNNGLTVSGFNLDLFDDQSSPDTLTFGVGAGVQNVNIGAGTSATQTDTYDTVMLSSTTLGGSMNVTAATIGAYNTGLPTGAVNLSAASADLIANGSNGPIGSSGTPLTTNLGQLTAATDDGGVFIANLGSGELTVDSIVADQGGQGPTVNNGQVTYGTNSGSPNYTESYSSGTSNVTITSAGPVALNSVTATGSLTVAGAYIVEGNGTSQAIDALSVDLDATGAVGTANGLVQAGVTFTPSASGDTISGPSWATLGFTAGSLITITGAADQADDGTFVIASISGDTLTLTVSDVLIAETSVSVELATTAEIAAATGVAGNYQGQITFANGNSGDTLTLPSTGPTWSAFGFSTGTAMAGDPIVISGANDSTNDATFTIASISDYTLTLQQSYALDPETEPIVSVSDGSIGIASSANSTSTTPTSMDVAETNGFTATTTNGNIYLTAGGATTSTAVDVVAGGTGNVSVTSGASTLTIQNITANGAILSGGGASPLGGTVAVDMTQGAVVESGTITGEIVSLTTSENIGTAGSPLVTSAASGLTVDQTATSSANAAVYIENTASLSSIEVTTDDGTVAISAPSQLLSFSNNHLSETGSAVVSFANTDTSGGLANNVTVNGTINAASISAGGQILANNGSTLIKDTLLPMLMLTAGNGIGNPTSTIGTEVTQLVATTKTGGIFVNNTPITGSGATVSFTTSNGAITSVTGATGTGYPTSSTFDLLVTGGGGTGGVVELTTNSSGAIVSFYSTPVAGGSGYSDTSDATTDNVLLLTATITTATQNGTINVADAGNIYLLDQTNTQGVSNAAAVSTSPTGTSGTVTLDVSGNIYNPSGVKANIATLAAAALTLTANGVGADSNPLQTSVAGLTLASAVPDGVFLSNNLSLTVTPTVTSGVIGGDVSVAAQGDLTLSGSLSGDDVTLTADGGALTSTSTTILTATGTLTLTAQQIGDSSAYSPDGTGSTYAKTEVLQTVATTIVAAANYGGIYISDASTSPLNLTAGAVGPEPTPGVATNNIEVYSAGNIDIEPQTTALTSLSGSQLVGIYNPSGTATLVAGNTLSYGGTATTNASTSAITSSTTLTSGNSGTYYDVDTGTLSVDGSAAIPSSTAATSTVSGALYGPLVVLTNTPGIPASPTTGSSAPPLELTASELAEGGSFTATSIIIDNLGVNTLDGQPTGLGQPTGQPGVLTISSSLTLIATDGAVVFLNPNDTIVVTGSGNTVTVEAGTTSSNGTISSANAAATSSDVTVLGNFETAGGNINISAVGNVSIGTVNAGSGHVFLTSLTGSILSSDGTALEITGATILKSAPQSSSQNASLVQLNAIQASAAATEAVAAYDAAVAQAGADQATLTAMQAQLTLLSNQVVTDKATVGTDTTNNTYTQNIVTAEEATIFALEFVYDGLELASAIVAEVGAALALPGDVAEAVPVAGPDIQAPEASASDILSIVADGLTIGADAVGLVLTGLELAEYFASNNASTTQNQLDVDQAQYQTDMDTKTDLAAAVASVQTAYMNQETIVEADAVIATAAQTASAQATAALVGTASPLPLTVAGPVTISDQGSGASGTSILINTPITVAAPGGAQVAFTAVNGSITSVNPAPAEFGSGYPASSTFDLLVTGGGGSGGVVQATTNSSGFIVSFAATPLAGGSGYTSDSAAAVGPSSVVATTGSGAQVSFTAVEGVITAVDLTAGGIGYPVDSTFDLMLTGGGGSGGVVQATTTGNVVTSISLIAGGSGYTTTGATAGSTGSGAQVSYAETGGVITSVNFVDGGTGYPDSETFDLIVTGGTGGVVQATTNYLGNVVSFSLVDGGTGYTGTTTGLAGVTIYSNSPLTVGANITAPGAIDLTADNVVIAAGTTIGSGSTLTITGDVSDVGGASVTLEGTLDAQSALINMDGSSPGDDTFNITPSATTPITVSGVGTDNTLNFNALGLLVTISETPTGDTITAAGMKPVMITNVAFANITNEAGVSFARLTQGTTAFTLNSVPLSASSAWVEQYGSFNISGTTDTAQSSTALATINGISNAANEAVDLTINSLTTGQQVGLVARYSGSGLADMYYGSIVATSASTYTAYIYLDVNGAATTLFSQNCTGSVIGATLEFDVVGDSLQLFLNSSLVAYANNSTLSAGGVGMLTSGGAVIVSNFNAAPITQQTASNNTYSDTFNSQGSSAITSIANGQLDDYWVNQYGDFTTGGTGTATASTSVALATVNGTNTATNEAVSLTISSLTDGEQAGLVARYNGQDLANMYYGSIVATSADTYTAYICLNVNGAVTTLFSQNYTGTASGATLEFAVAGDSLQLSLNGSLVAYANDSTFAAGAVGMLTSGGAVAVSNFNAAPIIPQMASSNSYSDSFTTATTGQLDDYWINQYGDFTTSGSGTATAATSTALATVNGIDTSTNEALSLTISSLATGQQVGLVARYGGSGLANLYYGSIMATSADTYTASIYINVNGTGTVLFSQNYTGTPSGETLEFNVVGSSLQLSLNGSLVAFANDSTFAAGGVGILTSGGAVSVSNFNASPITQQTASSNGAYSDNFMTTNSGQLDDFWVTQYGAFTSAGTGTATAVNTVSLATVNGITNANEAVSLTISSLSTGQQVGLVARYNGLSQAGLSSRNSGSGLGNMYYGSIVGTSADTYTAYIYLNVNGTWTPLFSHNYTGPLSALSGETLEFDVVGSSLQLSLNGSIVGYANDSTFASGGVGMLASGGAVAVSNFNAAPITQQAASSNTYSDTFTTSGQLDANWVNQYGDFTTAPGTATAATMIALATVNGTETAANEAVSLMIGSLTAGEQVGLVARYSGPGLANMYYGSIVGTSAGTYAAYIYLNVNGAWTPLFIQNYTGAPSTLEDETLEFDVIGSSLQLSLNGSIVAYANDSTFATGSVGMLTSGGAVAVSSFKATPIVQSTATANTYSDNFSTQGQSALTGDLNGQLDVYWVNQYGAFATGGTDTATAVSPIALATVNGITNADEAASLTINSLTEGEQVGLVARYSGSGLANMYLGSIVGTSADTYTAYIDINVNGVWTSLYNETYPGAPGTLDSETLEFDAAGSSLQLSLNGSIVAYASDSTFASGGVGMLTSGGAVAVSSFKAAPITQQSATDNSYNDQFNSQGQDAITGDDDSQLNAKWVDQYGDFQVNTTQQTATAMTSIALATINGISTQQTASNPYTDTFSTQGGYANEEVSLMISSLATGQEVGLVARYNGSGLANMYYGSIVATSADTYTAYIFLNVNGTWTPLSSQDYSGSPNGETLEFEVDGSSLQLNLGGSLVASANDSTFTAGGVGMLTAGGQVVVSNFNASATTGASNGQLDNYWVNQYGDFTTEGAGTATAVKSGTAGDVNSVSLATVDGITNANEAVSLTISSLTTGQQVGLVARYNGSGLANMYYGSIVGTSASTYTAYIYLNVNGAWTPLFAQNYTGALSALENETLEFDVVGSSLQLSLNGSIIGYANDSTFATGGVGMMTSGGAVSVSTFNATPITQLTASSNAYSENFTTSNSGQLDDHWVNQYGAFTTDGTGTATAVKWGTPTAVNSVSLATINGITNANEAVSLTISSLTTGQQVGLVARYNGSGLANMYYGSIVATSAETYTAYIYINVNGAWTPLFAQNFQGSSSTLEGDKLEFDVVGSSLQLSLNGSTVAYANDSTFATGGVGMMTSGGTVSVSNFNASPITLQTVLNNSYSDNFSTQGQSALTGDYNGQLDDYWVNQDGDFQVNTTNQTATALGSISLATVNGISSANEADSLTIGKLEPGEQVGLVARYSGSGLANMYYGSIVATSSETYIANIYMNVDGIWTSLFSETYSGSASTALDGKTLEFDAVGSSLQLFLNGSVVAYANNTTFTTGGVGMLTSGGAVVVSNFEAIAITPAMASYPFSNTASGTSSITGLSNGQLNTYWSIQSGDYLDNAGTLTGQSSGVNLATVNGVSEPNANVSATITLTAGQSAGLVTRYTGTGVQNMYFGEIVAGLNTYTAYIYRIDNGVWTQLSAQVGSGSVTGAVLEFEVSDTSLILKLNGTTVASTSDSTITGAGSVGILSSSGATISNFSAD